jgi:hypothetical protein
MSPGGAFGVNWLVMTPFRLMAAITSAGALALVAAPAHALQAAPTYMTLVANDFTAPDTGARDVTHRSTLEWDARKGRWGLTMHMEQHDYQGMQLHDIQPGVVYHLTRRLGIGGAVSLAPDEIGTSPIGDAQIPPPRVRLETTFKF